MVFVAGSVVSGLGQIVSIEPRRNSPISARSSNIRAHSNLVLIPVVVTDPRGRPILGLSPADFRLFDDQVEQRVTHFATEDVPVSVAIVLDSSGSMGPKLKQSREAVGEFLKTSNPGDEFALVQFSNSARLLEPLTDQSEQVQNRVLFIPSKGETALLDAVYLAISTLKNARHSRKALIIISDGGDNCSRYTVKEVKSLVREADVQIFSVAILEPASMRGRTPEELDGPNLLEDLANDTGGKMFSTDSVSDVASMALQISRILRNQYLIGFTPSIIANDGRYHRVHVQLPAIGGLRLSWRTGYYAPVQ